MVKQPDWFKITNNFVLIGESGAKSAEYIDNFETKSYEKRKTLPDFQENERVKFGLLGRHCALGQSGGFRIPVAEHVPQRHLPGKSLYQIPVGFCHFRVLGFVTFVEKNG